MKSQMPETTELPADVTHALKSGRKIEAIKRLREQRKIELKEAKGQVDAWLQENPDYSRQKGHQSDNGLGRLIFIIIVIAVLVTAWRMTS